MLTEGDIPVMCICTYVFTRLTDTPPPLLSNSHWSLVPSLPHLFVIPFKVMFLVPSFQSPLRRCIIVFANNLSLAIVGSILSESLTSACWYWYWLNKHGNHVHYLIRTSATTSISDVCRVFFVTTTPVPVSAGICGNVSYSGDGTTCLCSWSNT